MLRKLNKIIIKSELYYSSLVAAKLEQEKLRKLPKITCKRTNFNLQGNEIPKPDVKFGDIPLASSGWGHRRSKGDFFTIHATDENDPFDAGISVDSLDQINISKVIIKNLRNELHIDNITNIQKCSISEIMNKSHVLIAAETGCGKTLAYLTPIVQQILSRKKDESKLRDFNCPLALILTPGRELSCQIAEVAQNLCQETGIRIKVLQGGNTKQKMINPEFEDIDILIGSIGVISKLVTTGIYKTNQVRHVVLDEADTLLDDSFSDKLCYLLKKFPFHKNYIQDIGDKIVGTQLILASATMPTNLQELLSRIIDTETVHEIVSPNLHNLMLHATHKFLRINKSERPSQLLSLVKSELRKNRPIIVFSNKTPTSDFVSIFLNNNGVDCINLNGDMLMKIRIGQFEKFQNGDVNVLSTTDVGSRGLDTTRARHVINFDFPLHISDYIHRCGRIGRFGSHQKCFITNFISSQREIEVVQKIEHSARSGGLLPNVNANITNLIKKKILKNMNENELANIF